MYKITLNGIDHIKSKNLKTIKKFFINTSNFRGGTDRDYKITINKEYELCYIDQKGRAYHYKTYQFINVNGQNVFIEK